MTINYTRLQPNETHNGKLETDKAYAAFCIYRDMETDERSLEAVGKSTGKVRRLLERWSSQYHWVARAAAYDDVRRENERQQYEAERLKARKERQQLIRGAKSALALALPNVTRKLRESDGITVNEFVNLAKMVLQEERAEYNDLPTSRNEHTTYDLSKATEEQLERIANGEHPSTVMASHR